MNTSDAATSNLIPLAAMPGGQALEGELATLVNHGDDPCDVCEEALPGYVLGDLSSVDQGWIDVHTSDCRSCRDELYCYQNVDSLLDRCCQSEEQLITPQLLFRGGKQLRDADWGRIASPIGELLIAVSDEGVCEIGFGWMDTDGDFAARLMHRNFRPTMNQAGIMDVSTELLEYFNGKRNHFGVPLDYSGLTPFARSVLAATAEIPFGETRTYRDIAVKIGNPGATRAVGNALHNNPIPVIVPCHRIVRAGAGLGGYAGGVEAKRKLLSLEGAISPQSPLFTVPGI